MRAAWPAAAMPWGERPTVASQPAIPARTRPTPLHTRSGRPRLRPYPIRRAGPADCSLDPLPTSLDRPHARFNGVRNRPCGPLGGSQTHHQQPGGAPIRPDRPPSRPHHPHADAFRLAHVPMTRPPPAHHPRPGDGRPLGAHRQPAPRPHRPGSPGPRPPVPPRAGKGRAPRARQRSSHSGG